MDIDGLIDSFLSRLRMRGFSENTICAYAKDLKDFASFIEGKRLCKEEVFEYINRCVLPSHKPSTVNRKLSSIRAFVRYILREGHRLDISPDEIKNVKHRREPPQYVSFEKLKPLFSEDRDGLILLLMYACGLRVSELINLRVSDIMFQEGFIRVRGKGSKERIVPVDIGTLKLIEKYIKTRRRMFEKGNAGDYLFLSKRGGRLSRQAVWKIVKKKALSCGLDLHPHSFRHSFATHMIENGASLKAVKDMLGHESMTTTQIYTEISDKAMEEAFRKADIFEK